MSKDPNCEYCEGTGTVTVDYHDPSDYHGHGQYETLCECILDDEDQGGDGTEPVEPPESPKDKGGAIPSSLKINNTKPCKSTT